MAAEPGRTELSALVAKKEMDWGAGCTSERSTDKQEEEEEEIGGEDDRVGAEENVEN